MEPIVREARPADGERIIELAAAFAQQLTDKPPRLTAELFRGHGFGPERDFQVHVAEADGRVVGYAIAYPGFDPSAASRGAHLIDLYVEPDLRGGGAGRALLRAVARACRERGGQWLIWDVWKENAAAYAFYEHLGACHMETQTLMSLNGEAFLRLAT